MAEFQRRIPVWARETGDGAIDFNLEPTIGGVSVDYKIIEVRLHLSAAGAAGNLIISIDSDEDPVYNTILVIEDMATVTDFVWRPTPRALFPAGDKVNINWANASGRTYGLEVIWAHVRDGG